MHPTAPHTALGPTSDEANGPIALVGNNEIYTSPLLFSHSMHITRGIDPDLRYGDSLRAVIQPLPTQAPNPSSVHHPWGPTSAIIGNMGSFKLTFLEIQCPATTPPVSIITILTPGVGRDIIIMPSEGYDFVTVADVERQVIEWMKEVAASATFSPYGRTDLSKNFNIILPDGNDVEVELWMWKGLKRHGLESDIWELVL